MQIASVSTSAQAILSSSSQNIDGSSKASGSVGGTSQAEDPSQISGSLGSSEAVQSSAESVQEVAAPQETAAVETKVVTSADETLGTSLGLNIDTTA